ILKADKKRYEKMYAGQHLDEWLAFGPGHGIRRREAIRIAQNDKGHNYTTTMNILVSMAGMDPNDKKLMRCLADALWLTEDEDRMDALQEIRAEMPPGDRARLNSPITARQKVAAALDKRLTDPHERTKHGLPAKRKDKKP